MKSQLAILYFLVQFFCGCADYYYPSSSFKAGKATVTGPQSIQIDDTYKYYIRQVYKVEQGGLKTQRSFADVPEGLIEVEYLFISQAHKNVIYIATVPDKYQKYYGDSNRYLGEQFINVYDFKKICFGKIRTPNAITFLSKDSANSHVWGITYTSDAKDNKVVINTVEVKEKGEFTDLIPVSAALEGDVSFKQVEGYQILFYRNDAQKVKAYSIDNAIHIRNKKHCYEAIFSFDRVIAAGSSNIYFYNKRIEYSPEPLLH